MKIFNFEVSAITDTAVLINNEGITCKNQEGGKEVHKGEEKSNQILLARQNLEPELIELGREIQITSIAWGASLTSGTAPSTYIDSQLALFPPLDN